LLLNGSSSSKAGQISCNTLLHNAARPAVHETCTSRFFHF
jgi:hypothetical protein